MITKIIDPHIHLFDLKEGAYRWLTELNEQQQKRIARSFTPHDLHLNNELLLAGFVHIEAGFDNQQPWREIQYVERVLAQYNQNIDTNAHFSHHKSKKLDSYSVLQCRSAGYANLTHVPNSFADTVDKQYSFASCKGIRHILDDSSYSFLKDKHVLTNLQYLASKNLHFELQMDLGNTPMLSAFVEIVKRVPKLKVILNHAGFAPLNQITEIPTQVPSPELDAWQNNLRRLAKLPNLAIKCSGWEMMQADYNKAEYRYKLIACINHITACFGEDRMMFASNFPLVLFAQEYTDYWTCMIEMGRDCDLDIHKVCFDNAKRIYEFND